MARRLDSSLVAIQHLPVRYLSRRVLLASTMLLTSLASPRAQSVSGTVTGLDRKPDGATVTVLDRQRRVMGEVVVAEDGSFGFEGEAGVGSIIVRQEAVSITRGVVGGADHGITVDLSAAPRWRRTVMILDPAGAPAVGLDVVLRDVRDKTIACVTSGANGWLHVRGNQPVASLLLDPLGWQHAVAVKFAPGKLPSDVIPDLAIDMRPHAHKFVLLQGSIIDIAGAAVAEARVIASKEVDGVVVPCGLTKAQSDGSFKIWTSREATKLAAKSGGSAWERNGDWSDGGVQVVRLDEKHDGIVMVAGVVQDRDGKAALGAIIHVSQTATIAKGSRGIASTDRDGHFWVFVRRGAPFLVAALRERSGIVAKAGPWPQPKVVLKSAK